MCHDGGGAAAVSSVAVCTVGAFADASVVIAAAGKGHDSADRPLYGTSRGWRTAVAITDGCSL
jgi:hypothetical protein